MKWYYLTFSKDFIYNVLGINEFEWLLYTSNDKQFIINKANEYNNQAIINFSLERFNVYESEKKLKHFNKKYCTKIL